MKANRMQNLILICFGFFSALTFHPVWGRVSGALVGIFLAIVLICSMQSKNRFLLVFVLPIICFLLVTYAGNGLNNWLTDNSPEEVVGDIIHYFKETGRSIVPAVEGTTELVETGNPDSLTNTGLKLHYFMMFFFILISAPILCIIGYRNGRQGVISA